MAQDRRLSAWIAWPLLAACASEAGLPADVDVRPAMIALRADVHTIARELESGLWIESADAAARIASARLLSTRPGDLDPAFSAFERAMRDQGRMLRLALEQGDSRRSMEQFSLLLRRCDQCHETFRPGGVDGT